MSKGTSPKSPSPGSATDEWPRCALPRLSFRAGAPKSYGMDGAFCALVTSPFAHLSKDLSLLVDLAARERARHLVLEGGLSLTL